MTRKIEIIGEQLRSLIDRRGIIARYELLNRIYGLVRIADLDAIEREDLEKTFVKRVAPGIFASIMSASPLPELPKIDSFTRMGGKIFHFLHTGNYTKRDFETAYNQFLSASEELKELVVLNLRDLLIDFMADAGYSLFEEDGSGRLVFSNLNNNRIDFVIYHSINAVALGMVASVALVPHEESPEPFIEYYREKGRVTETAGLQVWVANLEDGTIDPFIGYPNDLKIYAQFKNPKLAMRIRSTWGTPG
jgi:hypothetical protein